MKLRRTWAWAITIGKAAVLVYGTYLGIIAHRWAEGTWFLVFGSM